MEKQRAYLDYNATAPLLPEAREAMLAALERPSNASSVHGEGREARKAVDSARAAVARLVGADPAHVVFTSGASEAAATLLTPEWRMGRAPLRFSRLYVAASDHPCLLAGGRFSAESVTRLRVGEDGVLDLAALAKHLAAHDTAEGLPLVAIHAANNESGVIQPVASVAEIVKQAGGFLLVDAVQAAGRLSLNPDSSCGDFLILSSHKIGGPHGAGAIVGRSDLAMPEPLIRGGGQEKGHRAGTENVAAIAGFGAAAAICLERLAAMPSVRALRDRFEQETLRLLPGATVYGKAAERLPNTLFFGSPELKAETAQIAFDLAGVSVSAGSACSSGKVGPSHVLAAMGFGDQASGIRVSIGAETGERELDLYVQALKGIAQRIKAPKAA